MQERQNPWPGGLTAPHRKQETCRGGLSPQRLARGLHQLDHPGQSGIQPEPPLQQVRGVVILQEAGHLGVGLALGRQELGQLAPDLGQELLLQIAVVLQGALEILT